ncbi:hypothetical protein [Microbacterium gorillae]|uniref:hypothetical protein n=1 Tax=Microbacterium gorillae TaxID=1231063 RepID=UPI000AFF3F86|nr:hypothetical protein [Microbacterium gorillae]
MEAAFADFDKLGRELFLLKHGFKPVNEAFVRFGTGRYDVRAVFAAAYANEHPDEEPLSQRQVAGGMNGAAGALAALGFVVVGAGDQADAQRFDTFEEALGRIDFPIENLPIIRDFLSVRNYREFFVPASKAYVGAKPRSGKPAHLIGRGYISYTEEDGRVRGIELPVRTVRPIAPLLPIREQPAARTRTPAAPRAVRKPVVEREEKFCPTCFLALPATGVCANCG